MVGETPPLAMFDVYPEPDRRAIRVAISGEVDMATVKQLRDALVEADRQGFGEVVVDLAGLSFIDSSGLRELVLAARRARRAGYPFRAINPSHHIRRLFELTALDKTIYVAPADV
jgi:anti-sigma B factor antagonist